MKPPRHVFFENLLSVEECDSLNTAFLNHIKSGWNFRDVIGNCMRDPFKYFRLNEDQIVHRLTEFIQSEYPEKIKYSHSYLRLYPNNSILKPHTDKKGLDITLSVNIGGLESWPIHISNVYAEKEVDYFTNKEVDPKFKESVSSFLTPKGCGVACYARKYPHWRDQLICDPREYVLQIFYHWTFIE